LINYSEKEDKNLFVHFYLDTEDDSYFSSWDRFFRQELIIKKPWIGQVDKDRNEFKVMRTRTGLFKTGISTLEVHGKLTKDKKIEIKIRPGWYAALSLLLTTFFLATIVYNYFNDIFGWLFLLGFLALQMLLMILDLRKTEEIIIDYIDRIRNIGLQQRFVDKENFEP